MSDESLAKAICDERERREEWHKDLQRITDMWVSGYYTTEEYDRRWDAVYRSKP